MVGVKKVIEFSCWYMIKATSSNYFFAWTLLNGLGVASFKLVGLKTKPPTCTSVKLAVFPLRKGWQRWSLGMSFYASCIDQCSINKNTLDILRCNQTSQKLPKFVPKNRRRFLSSDRRVYGFNGISRVVRIKSTIPVYSWRVVFHGGRSAIP